MTHGIKRLILPVSLLLVIGFVMTSLASYFVSRASLRSQISQSELPLTSDNIYSEIQRDLLQPIVIASFMATDTFLRDWILQGEHDIDGITRYLQAIQTKYKTFTAFFVSEPSRTYYHSTGILKTVLEMEERDRWYFRVREMTPDYEINVDPDLANKDAMTIFINHRVYDYNGVFIGATGVGLTVHAVNALIEKYQQNYARRIYFMDPRGKITLHGSTFPETIASIADIAGLASREEQILNQPNTTLRYTSKGEIFHANIRYVPEFNWFLVVEKQEGAATRQIRNALLVNLAVCAVITGIILLLTNLTIIAYQKRIETLRGIVPICSYCKQIRDDKGYWKQVEAYVAQHTEAKFSHGICPDCMEKNFPDLREGKDRTGRSGS